MVRAVKIINKSQTTEDEVEKLINEVNVLKKLVNFPPYSKEHLTSFHRIILILLKYTNSFKTQNASIS